MYSKNLTIVVGDTTEYLSKYAKNIDSDAYLIDSNNVNDTHRGVVYVSLGYVDLKSFINLLFKSSEIIFHPPSENANDLWSDKQTINKKYSMAWFSLYYSVIASNASNIPLHIPFSEENYKFKPEVPQRRVSNSSNIWIAGCSTTASVGVDKDKVYWKSVCKHLNLPAIDLAMGGSSISYASDQLLRADLKKGDKIIWGLTGTERFYWYRNKSIKMINSGYYQSNKEFDKIIPEISLLEDHWTFEALSAIYRVENVCDKIGVDLLLVGLHNSVEISAMLSSRKNFIMINGRSGTDFDSNFLDFGTDDLHPGPLTHEMYSKNILDRIDKLGWK